MHRFHMCAYGTYMAVNRNRRDHREICDPQSTMADQTDRFPLHPDLLHHIYEVKYAKALNGFTGNLGLIQNPFI